MRVVLGMGGRVVWVGCSGRLASVFSRDAEVIVSVCGAVGVEVGSLSWLGVGVGVGVGLGCSLFPWGGGVVVTVTVVAVGEVFVLCIVWVRVLVWLTSVFQRNWCLQVDSVVLVCLVFSPVTAYPASLNSWSSCV